MGREDILQDTNSFSSKIKQEVNMYMENKYKWLFNECLIPEVSRNFWE